MLEKIITIILPIYGIFMFFVRKDCIDLLKYSGISILCYIILFIEFELGLALFICIIMKILIDYVVN